MQSLEERKERLLALLVFLPVEDEVKQKIVKVLEEDLSEETIHSVVLIMRAQVKLLQTIADSLKIEKDADLAILEADVAQIEFQILK